MSLSEIELQLVGLESADRDGLRLLKVDLDIDCVPRKSCRVKIYDLKLLSATVVKRRLNCDIQNISDLHKVAIFCLLLSYFFISFYLERSFDIFSLIMDLQRWSNERLVEN